MISELATPEQNIAGVIFVIVTSVAILVLSRDRLSKLFVLFGLPIVYGALVCVMWADFTPLIFGILLVAFFLALSYTTKPIGSPMIYTFTTLSFISTPYIGANIFAMLLGLMIALVTAVISEGRVRESFRILKQFFSFLRLSPAMAFSGVYEDVTSQAKVSRITESKILIVLCLFLACYIFLFSI